MIKLVIGLGCLWVALAILVYIEVKNAPTMEDPYDGRG